MTRTASIRAQSVLQAVSASPALLSGNPRLDEKFLGAGVCQIFSDVSRDVGLGSVGATLEWTVASSNDPIQADINLYRYCGNNPLTRTDPTGLKFGWSDAAEAIWTALGYVVTGSEIPTAALCSRLGQDFDSE